MTSFNKYHAKTSAGYSSRKEHRRACELHFLAERGIITDLAEQVRFELIPAQYVGGKCVERACCYVADFVYTADDGTRVVEDTKGVRTKEYVIKRKLMLQRYGIQIKET